MSALTQSGHKLRCMSPKVAPAWEEGEEPEAVDALALLQSVYRDDAQPSV
jgi:hypothetical protein